MRPRDYLHDTIRQIKYRIHQPSSKIHYPRFIGHYFLYTLYRIALAPTRKPYRIGHLFTQKNGGFDAISLTERSCAALILKLDRHISDRLMWTGISDSTGSKWVVACENSRFASLFAAGDVSRGGTSATQRQKFHTDNVNQCLLINISGSHEVPHPNLFNSWSVLLKCCVRLRTSSSKTQMLLPEEEYIPPILTVLLEIHRVCIWPSWPFVCHS